MSTQSDRPGGFVLLVVAAALVGSAAVPGAAAQFGDASGDEVLERVEQRYDEAETVAGRAVVTTENASGTAVANVSFAYARPDSSRVVVERDGETYRTGTNGTVAWADGPTGAFVWDADALGERTERRLPVSESAVELTVPTDLNASAVDATVAGTTSVDGTAAYVLEVVPESGERDVDTTLWVATDDYRVLRAVTADGTNRTVVDVEAVRFDVSVHESTFRPPGDRVEASSFARYDSFAATQAATALDLPALEDGRFTEATVTVRDGETVVVQRYALDGENASVVSTTATDRFDAVTENASTVRIDGREAAVSRVRDGSVVVWTDGGVSTAVVVEGAPDRAVEVARLLRA